MSWRRKKPVSSSAVSFNLPNFVATRGFAMGATGPVAYSEPVAPPKIEDRGLAIEPIVGQRAFTTDVDVESKKWTLYSYNGAPWPYRAAMAAHCSVDLFAAHEVPDEHCACGIYAWKPGRPEMLSGMHLQGEVNLWGEVLICDLGYRAEFAYPKSLTITAKPTRSVQRIRDGLAEAYGVPVSIVEPSPITESADATYGYTTSYGLTGPTGPFLSFGG